MMQQSYTLGSCFHWNTLLTRTGSIPCALHRWFLALGTWLKHDLDFPEPCATHDLVRKDQKLSFWWNDLVRASKCTSVFILWLWWYFYVGCAKISKCVNSWRFLAWRIILYTLSLKTHKKLLRPWKHFFPSQRQWSEKENWCKSVLPTSAGLGVTKHLLWV